MCIYDLLPGSSWAYRTNLGKVRETERDRGCRVGVGLRKGFSCEYENICEVAGVVLMREISPTFSSLDVCSSEE